MSLLPNAERAIVPLEKFTEYALNPDHPTGRHKARVFQAILGLTLADAPFLRDVVQDMVLTHEAEPEPATPYGQRYVIDFVLQTPTGAALVRTTWMIRVDEDFPRLTSCYVR